MSNKQVVIDFIEKGYNNKDYDAVIKLLDENYYDHSPAKARSPYDAVNILKIVENIFSDMNVEWNPSDKSGRVKCLAFFGDTKWYCWNGNHVNITCPQ